MIELLSLGALRQEEILLLVCHFRGTIRLSNGVEFDKIVQQHSSDAEEIIWCEERRNSTFDVLANTSGVRTADA